MHKNKTVNLVSMCFEPGVRSNLQFIGSIEGNVVGCIDCEAEVASSIKANLVAIHVYRGFIIHSSKIEQNSSSDRKSVV